MAEKSSTQPSVLHRCAIGLPRGRRRRWRSPLFRDFLRARSSIGNSEMRPLHGKRERGQTDGKTRSSGAGAEAGDETEQSTEKHHSQIASGDGVVGHAIEWSNEAIVSDRRVKPEETHAGNGRRNQHAEEPVWPVACEEPAPGERQWNCGRGEEGQPCAVFPNNGVAHPSALLQCPRSSRNFSASSAAMQPEPAAVIAWR